ncbi:hypothetical protein AVEN_165479-1 [Araneus ventricosus]|uniref:Uncharacterized protein n=1 Tax=Araneus ventricosus TaxID=182803 RepID=A0A4Y2UDN3_ARAVE|nr:hypothetical protein AVEN_165479-1 [Araneus ventricosus]
MYISQYPPPHSGNSFCLGLRCSMRDPKVPGTKLRTATVVTTGRSTHTLTFSPTSKWQHQKSHQFHLLLHSPDCSTTTPTATQPSEFKVYDKFHSTKLVHKHSGQQSAHMHAAHGRYAAIFR